MTGCDVEIPHRVDPPPPPEYLRECQAVRLEVNLSKVDLPRHHPHLLQRSLSKADATLGNCNLSVLCSQFSCHAIGISSDDPSRLQHLKEVLPGCGATCDVRISGEVHEKRRQVWTSVKKALNVIRHHLIVPQGSATCGATGISLSPRGWGETLGKGTVTPRSRTLSEQMSKTPLFSTYRQGENRVTSSMVAVFERIDLSVLERLLAAASAESTLEMVAFSNQPAGRGASIPDARISARFSFWFEVKTTRNAVDRTQLEEHLWNLDDDSTQERLFVVTPDAAEPSTVEAIGDRRIIWFNFASLADAIDAAISDQAEPVADQARFLLRELRSLLAEDGLIDNDEVVVMAARAAYPEYLAHHVYVCQPGRTFRDGLTHLGFYAEKAIQPHVARILFREDAVVFSSEEAARRRDAGGVFERRIAETIDVLLEDGSRQLGESYQVFLLSGPDEAETVKLARPLVNASTSASGRPTAWTMGQRYTSLARLTKPGIFSTDELGG